MPPSLPASRPLQMNHPLPSAPLEVSQQLKDNVDSLMSRMRLLEDRVREIEKILAAFSSRGNVSAIVKSKKGLFDP